MTDTTPVQSAPASKQSVRGPGAFFQAGVRPAFRMLGRLAPGLAAAAFERLFFTPPRPRRSRGEATLDRALPIAVHLDGRKLAAWQWGTGPAMLLVHGWGGQAAQFSDFVAPLLARGLSVVAFDGPGHGKSGRAMSSLPHLARAARAVSDSVGGVRGVVAHSLGAAAVALAMGDGLLPDRVVFLAPVANPIAWIPAAAVQLGLGPGVIERVRVRTERRLHVRWSELSHPADAAGFDSPLLVFHDRDDTEVPMSDAKAIAGGWPGGCLVETTGLGHNRLLRDPDVIARAVAFLATKDEKGAPAE